MPASSPRLTSGVLAKLALRRARLTIVAVLAVIFVAACGGDAALLAPKPATPGLDRLEHLVVIYLENHSFDNLYGEFPGANGFTTAPPLHPQVDLAGNVLATLPDLVTTEPDELTLVGLPNQPFSIEDVGAQALNDKVPDPVHGFYEQQVQIDGGRMDKFAIVSDVKALAMGYYHTSGLPLGAEAAQYTLCDNFFHAAFGGSFLNHFWLVAARTPVFPDAPAGAVIQLDDTTGLPVEGDQGYLTPDGYVVNVAFSVNRPHPETVSAAHLVPAQTFPTIGDRLSERGVSWAWYAGGWDDAVAGRPDSLFQFHHQPFVYFENFREGTAARAEHLKDEKEFLAAAAAGTLPAVSFVKPLGPLNEHPGYAGLLDGELHAKELIDAVRSGPAWASSAIIVTYDENGGFWDHAAPPAVDRWGPGTRVPTIIISPFARRGFVDHTLYDTTSILALIERRWGLAPLAERDANANDLTAAFDFQQPAAR